jgi:hypothetical protein
MEQLLEEMNRLVNLQHGRLLKLSKHLQNRLVVVLLAWQSTI